MRLIVILFVGVVMSCSSIAHRSQVSKSIENLREEKGIVSFSYVVIKDNEVVDISSSGLRAIDKDIQVTTHDKYHLGSVTKSMTALLTAKLVDKGVIKFSTTLDEIFKDLKIHEQFKKVTVEQLLRYEGGLTGALLVSHKDLFTKFIDMQKEGLYKEQRSLLSKILLEAKPSGEIGGKQVYSNAGISIVGHALETIANKSYEELLTEEIFIPLDMNSCGFGPAGIGEGYSQPWQHTLVDGKLVSYEPTVMADNPDALTPAGKAHCSVIDLGKYLKEYLSGLNGKSTFISKTSYQTVFNLVDDKVLALGWVRMKVDEEGKPIVFFHNGSNTANYAEVWLDKKNNMAIGMVANEARVETQKTFEEFRKLLDSEFLK